MSSLRDTLETTYAAAAFAERNLKSETSEYMETAVTGKNKTVESRAKTTTKRPRPSIKA